MKYLIILAALLSGCASMEQSQGDREYQALEAELKSHADLLAHDLDSGKLSQLEYSKKRLVLQEHFFPNSYNTLATLRDRLALASALDRGDITRLQFDMAWSERKRQHEARKAEDEARYQQQIAQQQNQPMNPVAAMMMMNMLNNNMNRNFPRPSHCASYDVAGTTHTDCY